MKFPILLMMIILLGCSKNDPGPIQLLSNPNMESGQFNNPDSWTSHSTGGTNYNELWTTDAFYSSNHSLEITCSTADVKNESYWVQAYNSSSLSGKNLVFGAKLKGVKLSGPGAYLVIDGYSGNNLVNYIWSQPITGDFDWAPFRVILRNVDKSVDHFYFYFVMAPGTTGTVYFDDASLSYN
jgi:hypothetical protein